MRTFVAVVLERITTKCIAFAIFNVNNTFNPSHTLISKSLCDKNRQLWTATKVRIADRTVDQVFSLF
jgi:hypothetical protein